MSRGPLQEVGLAEGGDYAAAFRALNKLVDEGRSWSGNERNRCFLNTGQVRFADVSATTGLDFLDDARTTAHVDWEEVFAGPLATSFPRSQSSNDMTL